MGTHISEREMVKVLLWFLLPDSPTCSVQPGSRFVLTATMRLLHLHDTVYSFVTIFLEFSLKMGPLKPLAFPSIFASKLSLRC